MIINNSNAKDFLPLVQALAEGKKLQILEDDGRWTYTNSISIRKSPADYRIANPPQELWIICENNRPGCLYTYTSYNEASQNLPECWKYHPNAVIKHFVEVLC